MFVCLWVLTTCGTQVLTHNSLLCSWYESGCMIELHDLRKELRKILLWGNWFAPSLIFNLCSSPKSTRVKLIFRIFHCHSRPISLNSSPVTFYHPLIPFLRIWGLGCFNYWALRLAYWNDIKVSPTAFMVFVISIFLTGILWT